MDLPLYAAALLGSGNAWLNIRNRNEHLEPAPNGYGYRCQWQWTSDLYAPKVIPALGRQLMQRALHDWPIVFQIAPAGVSGEVAVSFIIGHRGTTRLPHLQATLQTIAAQRDASIECIVVEQSVAPEIRDALPAWVQYIHTPLPHLDMPYCRSWAFNVGARLARGQLLVFHDNDMLLPQDYTAELLARYHEGYEVINLKRFIFYIGSEHSQRIFSSDSLHFDETPDTVVQNLEAGGSIAVDRDAYFAIGGFDESFVGWGGEDNEFWERAQTRKIWPYMYLPIVHLWHEAQPEKSLGEKATTIRRFSDISRISSDLRITRLRNLGFGSLEGPAINDHV